MQDIGSKEDTELSREGLILSLCRLSVESVGHCQSVGNWLAVVCNSPALSGPCTGMLDSKILFCREVILSTNQRVASWVWALQCSCRRFRSELDSALRATVKAANIKQSQLYSWCVRPTHL